MRVGIKILDEAEFRKILDDGFDRLGYQLANSDVDEPLYLAHYCHLTSRRRGTAYLLKFTKVPEGNWNAATLIVASRNVALAVCDLEMSSDEQTDAHHRRWAHRIVKMFASAAEPL